MQILEVRNVHQALPDGIDLINRFGHNRESRFGRVRKMHCPVVTMYSHPLERVLFWPERNANPFLHLFEALYLLKGRDDVYFLKQFAQRMEQFSDDGKTFHGSYGRRWRSWFKLDQIQNIIDTLKNNKNDRRCVLEMWDASKDLGRKGVDVPCNTHVYFSVGNDDKLNMTVCCRSNDIVWGAYGSNMPCFSILQEYIAAGINLEVGVYYQMSNDYHAYLDVIGPLVELGMRATDPYRENANPYHPGHIEVTPVVDLPLKQWDEDLAMWFLEPYKVGLRSKFFLRVATPMYAAWAAHREKDYTKALEIVNSQMPDHSDWKVATVEWLERRKTKHEQK